MKRLALAAALISVTTTVAAQSPAPPLPAPQAPQSSVFRSGASLVGLNVTVTDGKRYVTGLQPDDFAVYEDGVLQQVRFFEAVQVPLDLILLIDASASMRDKLDVVQEAALGFMKTLRPGDRGAVVAFHDGVEVLQELTTEAAAIEAAIRGSQARGGTALHNAVYVSLKQFGRAARDSGEVRRQAIAVLSDGNDTASLLSFDDVLGQARRSGVSVYTIALKTEYLQTAAPGGRRYFSESDYALRTLAQETGGQAFFPAAVHELKDVYGAIAAELASQYSIGYAPANGRVDGRFRRIIVRVTARPELRLRARSGYLADAGVTSPLSMLHPPRPR